MPCAEPSIRPSICGCRSFSTNREGRPTSQLENSSGVSGELGSESRISGSYSVLLCSHSVLLTTDPVVTNIEKYLKYIYTLVKITATRGNKSIHALNYP